MSANAAASTDQLSVFAPAKALPVEKGNLSLFMEYKLTPPIMSGGKSRGRVLADISVAGSGPIQQGPLVEGTTASTQRTALAALFLDEAINGPIGSGDSPRAELQAPVGAAAATSRIADSLRKGYTLSPAGRAGSPAAAVDQIMADIFKYDDPDYAKSGFADDLSRTIWPIGDGETRDDFFGRFQGQEELAMASGYADEV